MIHQMFAVPIGIYDNIGSDQLNRGLLEAIRQFPSNATGINLLANDHAAFAELQSLFLKAATEMLNSRFESLALTPKIRNSWANQHAANHPLLPHAHPHSLIAGVYYPLAPDGCGDLLLQDPNAGSMWGTYSDGQWESVAYTRIPAKPGRMVLFPGHIVHSVAPGKVMAPRVSIAVNFSVERK